MRLSGTPNATSTLAPTVTPTASAKSSSTGRTVPVTSRAPTIVLSTSHVVRHHERFSQGASATAIAAAVAKRAGLGNQAPASHEP